MEEAVDEGRVNSSSESGSDMDDSVGISSSVGVVEAFAVL